MEVLGTHWCELCSRLPFLCQDLAPTRQPEGSRAGMPQAKQPTEWEHSPTHQQTGCLKSS